MCANLYHPGQGCRSVDKSSCPRSRRDELHTYPCAWRSKRRIGVSEPVLQDVSLSIRQRIGGFSTTDEEVKEQCHVKRSNCWLTDLHPAALVISPARR